MSKRIPVSSNAEIDVCRRAVKQLALEIGFIDLVMTDLRMPEMDGIQLTRAIRRIRPDLPIIVYSAYRFIDTAPAALKAGANEYLAKPFLQNKIKQTVERLLKEQE